ncbi:MAG: TolC family protein [Telluria sp.]
MRSGCWMLLTGALWGGTCAASGPVTLGALERLVDAAPAVRLAEADRVAAQARQEVALAQAGPRLFAGASAERLHDPGRPEQYAVQTIGPDGSVATSSQRLTPQDLAHQRYAAVVGVRLPLFGSRELTLRAIDTARSDVDQQRFKEALSRLEARSALRHAYVDAWFRPRQAQLARAYLSGEQGALRILQLRSDARLLLAPERRAVELTFLTARQNSLAAGSDSATALQRLAIFAGRELAAAELAPPALTADCVTRAAALGALERHPDILFHAAQLEHRRRLLAVAGTGTVEGGISLSHARLRESGSNYGHSTGVALEVSVPLGAAGLRRAQRAQAAAEVSRAQLALDSRRQEYLAVFDRLAGELHVRGAQLDLVSQRLDAARDAWRIASVRAASLDGGLAGATLQARFDVYAAANEWIEAQAAQAHAQVDLLGFGVDCGHADAPPSSTTPGGFDAEAMALLAVNAGEPAAPAAVATAVATAAAAPGWYAWDGLRRYAADPARFWPAPGAGRILLSLDRDEIAAARANGPGAALLRALLEEAHRRGVRVELLLGDPGWALPGGADDLAGVVRDLTRFAFDGVHLDLERMQLDEAQRAAWPDGLVAAVARLKATTPLPLSLSLHPRDAAVPGLLRRLHEAGLVEVTFMAYLTNPDAVAARLLPVLRAHPGLRFSVAQSVEPALPDGESHARASRTQQDAAWKGLSVRFGTAPNFTGIIIQSLEHHADGARHEN